MSVRETVGEIKSKTDRQTTRQILTEMIGRDRDCENVTVRLTETDNVTD